MTCLLQDLSWSAPTCNMVMTRARASQGHEREKLLGTLPFFNEEVETSDSAKPHCPRRQKRLGKIYYNVSKLSVEPVSDLSLDFKRPLNVVQLQQEDPSLVPLWKRARQAEEETFNSEGESTEEKYFVQQGVLYCH